MRRRVYDTTIAPDVQSLFLPRHRSSRTRDISSSQSPPYEVPLCTACPDVHFTVEDQVAEGDKVATRLTTTGTYQGEFAGIPATGKPVSVTAMNIHRVSGDQIQEAWFNWDALGMMQQLGVVPAPE